METLSKFANDAEQRFESQESFNLELTRRMNSFDTSLIHIKETMATKDDVRRLEEVIDGYAAKIDNYAAEMAAMHHRIDRLERMIDFLAAKAGISKHTLEAL